MRGLRLSVALSNRASLLGERRSGDTLYLANK